ncbi:porin [Pelobacter seleniigenes]|uniref:porin n=1 Tax=Pelobacter seleniigenes TaxID=407188 RepID=UPI0004A77CC0|nr:porin [Pelobacter seleniigenes]
MNTFFRKSLLLVVISLIPISSYAIDLGTYNDVKFDLGLQINRALMYVDDGSDKELFNVDNDNSSTRFNLNAETAIDNEFTIGAFFEAEFQSNASNDVDFESKSSDAVLNERYMEVYVKSKRFGQLSLGQGSGAADGNMERDLSGTNVINWANPALLGGAIRFGQTGPKISQTMTNLDFESRYDRVRYDTPKFGPVRLAISYGTKDDSDVTEAGVRLEKKFDGGTRLRGALGYSIEDTEEGNDTGKEKTVGGSFAILLSNGINGTVAVGKSSDDDSSNPDSKFSSLKVGYLKGRHAVSVMYAMTKDRSKKGDESSSIGLGYVFSAKEWLDFYAGYKVHSLDRKGSNYDDIKILTTGLRARF